MFKVQDKLGSQLETLKSSIQKRVEQLDKHLNIIEEEYFTPADATWEVVQIWSTAVNAIWEELDRLELYRMVDGLSEFADMIETWVLEIVDRYDDWSKRKVISTKEAGEKINRSRSTVYRWIKAGKLKARKVGRYWQIAM